MQGRGTAFAAVLGLGFGLWAGPAAAVEYTLTFEAFWDASHIEASSLPGNAHFTELAGATHAAGSPLWQLGGLATLGIERVAEAGSTSQLESDVNALITAGTAGQYIEIDDINDLPGSDTISIQVSGAHPNVTLLSMIAPSPDWFVGVSNLSLQSGGQWLPQVVVDLHPYDAGTEDGSTFSLSNPDTDPQEPIALQIGSPFIGLPVIGRLTFTLVPEPVPLPAWPALLGVLGALLVAKRGLTRCTRQHGIHRS